MALDGVADGWELWSDERTKAVLAYRPDVFDETAFPAPCLPTIYLTRGKRGRRPGRTDPGPDADWHVTLFLEPEVEGPTEVHESRADAERGAARLATAFANGEVAYRDLYQVPRPDYFEKLDELTGRSP